MLKQCDSRVLVFDSGVGGLSVLSAIQEQLPHLSLSYLMDTAAFPYGIREDEWLQSRILAVCKAAVDQYQPQLLVVGCNTASTLALATLREHIDIPIVGVVPAIKVAAGLSKSRHIGLLATPATVNGQYTQHLINDFAADCQVQRFGSPLLVQMAEDWITQGQSPDALYEHLTPWLQNAPDMSHIVLGCTHFPLLRPQLERLWPERCWIDSGNAIARRVASLLTPASVVNDAEPPSRQLIYTGEQPSTKLLEYLQNQRVHGEFETHPLQKVIHDEFFV